MAVVRLVEGRIGRVSPLPAIRSHALALFTRGVGQRVASQKLGLDRQCVRRLWEEFTSDEDRRALGWNKPMTPQPWVVYRGATPLGEIQRVAVTYPVGAVKRRAE